MSSKHERRQLNVRVDEEFDRALEAIRRIESPIPTASEVVRKAVLEYHDRLIARIDRDRRKSQEAA